MGKNFEAYFELTFAMIIVGSSVVVGKMITNSFPIFLASGLRFALASIVLIPILIRVEKGIPIVGKKDFITLFIQSLTGVFGFSVFLLYGLKFTSASDSGIITSTTPAVIGIISFVFLKERLKLNKIIGIVLTVIGVISINVTGIFSSSTNNSMAIVGNILIFGAVIGEALFTIMGKVVSERLSPIIISTFVTVLGFFMFLPFAVYEAISFDFSKVHITSWIAVTYYAIVVTVIGFYLWYKGVSKVSAATSGIFTSVLPVSSLLLSYLILKEEALIPHFIGALFVLIGILVSTIRFNKAV